MAIPSIITGDDNKVPVDLTINKASFDMTGKTTKSCLVSTDHTTAYTEEVVLNEAESGADYANSRVIASFPGASTIDVQYQGNALIEIQVEFPEKKSWFIKCKIIRGNIA
jgi:hypothetical protein